MNEIFRVTGFNGMVSVYGVRTAPNDSDITEFLMYVDGYWVWERCDPYRPSDKDCPGIVI